jgi:predicted RND superfamily exporter protein
VDLLPDYLTRRFVTAQEDAIVITGRLPDIDVAGILPVVDKLDRALQPVREAHPGVRISVTGLPAIAARNTESMIGQLNRSLFGAVLLAVAVLALALRSFANGLYSLIPNLLPIFAAGALLLWTGIGLQFASIIGMTVAFGLAIDNIVHFLYRLGLEDQAREGDGRSCDAVQRALDAIAPVILLTTAVLLAGLAMPVFSSLPSLRLFGMLNALSLAVALVAALVILPAIILVMRKLAAGKSCPGTGVTPFAMQALPGGSAKLAVRLSPGPRRKGKPARATDRARTRQR